MIMMLFVMSAKNKMMTTKINNWKETMTNQELKNKVINNMKKDNDLKKYVKDFQDLSNEQFDILMKIIDKAYLKVKNKESNKKTA